MNHKQLEKLEILARIKSDQALARLANCRAQEARLIAAGEEVEALRREARQNAQGDIASSAALPAFERHSDLKRAELGRALAFVKTQSDAALKVAARDFGRTAALDGLKKR